MNSLYGDFVPNTLQQEKKQVIILTGRVHPGETIGSWAMEGFMKKLVCDSVVRSEAMK